MAHAGTPTDLTKRPTTSLDGVWRAVVATILVVALAAGIVAVGANLTSKAAPVPATNHGSQIQAAPGADPHDVVGHKGALIYQ